MARQRSARRAKSGEPPLLAAPAAAVRPLYSPPCPAASWVTTHRGTRFGARRTAASSIVFTPDASRLLVVGGDAVAVLDTSTRAQQQRMDIPAVMAAALSPLGTYLITYQRPTKTEGGAGTGKRSHRSGCTDGRVSAAAAAPARTHTGSKTLSAAASHSACNLAP